MAKSRERRTPVDIFDDGDLSAAEDLLSSDAPPPAKEAAPDKAETLNVSLPDGADRRSAEHLERAPDRGGAEAISAALKFSVRQSTRARFDAFKLELSAALGGVRLNDSNVGRALISWFLEEGADRVVAIARSRVVQRPPTDDLERMAEFDRALSRIVGDGVRKSR